MKSRSSPKTPAWPFLTKKRTRSAKGTSTVIAICLFFVFSTLGLSLLVISQIYLKTSAYRKHSAFLDYSSENGIKKGFHQLLDLAAEQSPLLMLTDVQTEELRTNARDDGIQIVEDALGIRFPLQIQETWNNLAWRSVTSCSLAKLDERTDYFLTTSLLNIRSEGTMANFRPRKNSTLEASLKISAGRVPLPTIPLLLDKDLGLVEREGFLSRNHIEFLPSPGNSLRPRPSFSGNNLVPSEATALISKALKIKMLYPQNLSNAELRIALGLEAAGEPVPDGVYLIKDDFGLGGIYVQGDLEEMVLAIDDDFQVISFRNSQDTWLLRFSPIRTQTLFISPEGTLTYDLVPQGIIIVNGKIKSLGGGILDSFGNAVLVKDREIPSVARGASLTIVSSDKITISTHLILQGVKWQNGIPYIKDSNAQLIIYSTARDFWQGTARDGGISIDSQAPRDIKIQATLTARGTGLAIEGEGKVVELLGSLQVSDFNSNGNSLKIAIDGRLTAENNDLQNSPATSSSVLHVSSFQVLAWKEY